MSQPHRSPPHCNRRLRTFLINGSKPAKNAAARRARAGDVLRRLLDAGLSRYEPNPIAALERAEAEQRQK